MIPIEVIKNTLTLAEMTITKDFLKSSGILSYKRSTISRVENPLIAVFNNLVFSESAIGSKHEYEGVMEKYTIAK